MPGFEKDFFSTSRNVTIFLEPGTNVTISFHFHIVFLGSAWNNQKFENPGFWVQGFPIPAWNDPESEPFRAQSKHKR